MPRIADALARPGSDWKVLESPLTAEKVAEARQLIGRALPEGLLELYHICNSGEGSLPFQPWHFELWGIECVADLREDEFYRKHYNQFVFFGSSGGGDYFGLDPLGRIFIMDPVAGERSNEVVAASFDQFAEQIGCLPPGGVPVIVGP